ncbi:MAG: ABC transporter permease [Solirubrobacteraceae bacterium]
MSARTLPSVLPPRSALRSGAGADPADPARPRRPWRRTRLLRTQVRLFLREPLAVAWVLGLPVIILLVIGATTGGERQADLGGLRVVDTYVPTLSVLSLAMLAFSALPATLVNDREWGILRRLATTPVGPRRLLTVHLTIYATVAAVSLAAVVVVGRLAFGVPLPDPFIGFVIVLVVAGGSLLSIGVLLAAVAPTGRAAGALGAMTLFPTMFLGGLWLPREAMSDTLRQISDLTPVGAAVGALQDVTTAGAWPSAGALLVMVAWGVAAALPAAYAFRWE